MRFTLALLLASAASTQAGVFTQTTYNAVQISGGTAGNAQAEAEAVFSALDQNDLAGADQDDIAFLDSVNQICNGAEDDVFNGAVAAATGDAADALQRGKIKNKVLKLTASVLRLSIDQAQGKDTADELATEQGKLATNIQQDEDEAGNPSTAVQFDATTS
ncbi:Uu.00g025840.m01.CDS01 [Anthostomella pinea]|uniref:Uu.00g025840.m01.CDS01 n=1 Tax=Anthostomella pinea TaxID=933095 RepID=A0AAI8V7E6_9PEZI|nr:Uu.00g025840.m01.CDS01 [Anthostomella pinea]